MYFIRSTESAHRVPYATLDRAIAKLQRVSLNAERRFSGTWRWRFDDFYAA